MWELASGEKIWGCATSIGFMPQANELLLWRLPEASTRVEHKASTSEE
jgi:hypothetical protein